MSLLKDVESFKLDELHDVAPLVAAGHRAHHYIHGVDGTHLHDLMLLLRLTSIRLDDTKRLLYRKIHDEVCPVPYELFRTQPVA